EEFDKFHTDLGAILQFIKHQSQEDNTWMQDYARFEQVEREAIDVINKVTGTNIEYEESEEVVNMCRAWDNSMIKAREEGLQEGISTTRAVFKAYISGKNAEEIAKELKMPLEEVEEVLA
ncbi:MAG: hypothetical protein PUG66_00370, partial [Clostridiales bacterium]|nr:hypothetical protein [Clostridiales bacterium]